MSDEREETGGPGSVEGDGVGQGAPPEPPEHEPETGLPTLLKPALMPVESMVFCLDHLAVHADTVDPYGSGDDTCEPKDHRPLYYRARKGDPNDRKTDVEPTMIAGGEALTQEQRHLLAGMARDELEQVVNARESVVRLFGDDDVARFDRRIELLEDAYKRLGGEA